MRNIRMIMDWDENVEIIIRNDPNRIR